METASRQAVILFVAEALIRAGKPPAAYNGAQAWSFFDTLARSLPLTDPYAVYFWYASVGERVAFVEDYNACFIGL